MNRLIKVGKVIPKNASEIKHSRIGVGFEKLDRYAFDPEKAYDKMAAIGVKWARIQSGWQRTEQEKGVYDFAWLDSIVDNLNSRGVNPWVDVCYGNKLYNKAAEIAYGAVGCPPINSEEEKEAWRNYVKALVAHFMGRVVRYEIWNEPDNPYSWKHADHYEKGEPDTCSGTELGCFTVDTAKAIREVDKDCEIVGAAFYKRSLSFLTDAFEAGMGDWIDTVSFHEYTHDESDVPERVRSIRGVINRYNPKIQILQGESGSQSRNDGKGALRRFEWTPRKQVKQLLRHTMMDLTTESTLTSYFSCLDMKEALHGTASDTSSYKDFGYFGVLGASFDADGNATGEYTPKESYYALQNLCAMFSDNLQVEAVPVIIEPEDVFRAHVDARRSEINTAGFRLDDGSLAYVYWANTDLITTDYESATTLLVTTDLPELKLVDLYDGTIYKIPEDMIEKTGINSVKIQHIPVKDYPMVLIIGKK